jgi:hypothetical protein
MSNLCMECKCPISHLSRMGIRFKPVAGQKSCSLCGSPESSWPSSFQKDPREVAQQIQNHPYWASVLGGANDTGTEHTNPICCHQCKVCDFTAILSFILSAWKFFFLFMKTTFRIP